MSHPRETIDPPSHPYWRRPKGQRSQVRAQVAPWNTLEEEAKKAFEVVVARRSGKEREKLEREFSGAMPLLRLAICNGMSYGEIARSELPGAQKRELKRAENRIKRSVRRWTSRLAGAEQRWARAKDVAPSWKKINDLVRPLVDVRLVAGALGLAGSAALCGLASRAPGSLHLGALPPWALPVALCSLASLALLCLTSKALGATVRSVFRPLLGSLGALGILAAGVFMTVQGTAFNRLPSEQLYSLAFRDTRAFLLDVPEEGPARFKILRGDEIELSIPIHMIRGEPRRNCYTPSGKFVFDRRLICDFSLESTQGDVFLETRTPLFGKQKVTRERFDEILLEIRKVQQEQTPDRQIWTDKPNAFQTPHVDASLGISVLLFALLGGAKLFGSVRRLWLAKNARFSIIRHDPILNLVFVIEPASGVRMAFPEKMAPAACLTSYRGLAPGEGVFSLAELASMAGPRATLQMLGFVLA